MRRLAHILTLAMFCCGLCFAGQAVQADVQVSVNPSSVTMPVNGSQTFNATYVLVHSEATSDDTANYQWSVDSSQITGATGAAYTYSPATTGTHTVSCTVTMVDGKGNTVDSGTGSATVTAVGVAKLQYNDPLNGWTDVSGTLYVLKGTTVSFQAIPDPSSASFPSGQPVWGGTSGASGTGATTTVTFSTQSANTSDAKTVTATCGNAATANVIVFDLVPHAASTDNTVLNHSPTSIGVGEIVNLTYTTLPSGLSTSQVGDVTWSANGGGTMISKNPYQFQAGAIAGGVTLTLEIMTGPSTNGLRNLVENIFAPSLAYQVSRDNVTYHKHNTASAGIYTYYCVTPSNVSFANVGVRETDCTPTIASGFLSGLKGYYHMGGNGPPLETDWVILIFDQSVSVNTWRWNTFDQVGLNAVPDIANYAPTGYGAGKVTYQIPFNFHVNNGPVDNSYLINSVLQTGTTDSSGTATISKSAVSATAHAADPYVGPFATLW